VEHAPNLIIAALLLGQIAFIGWISAHFRGKVRELEATLRVFVTPKGPDQASPLASCVDVAADMVARAVTARIKTSLMGSQSGQVRQEKAVEGAIAEDMVRAAHPLAGTLLDAMPELRKTLKKNPQLLDFALSKLAGMNSPGTGAPGMKVLAGQASDLEQTITTLIKTGGINGQKET